MPEAPKRIWGKEVCNTAWCVTPEQTDPEQNAYILETAHAAQMKAALDTHAALAKRLSEVAAQRDKARRAMRLALVWLNTQHPTNNAVKQTLAHTKEELRTAISTCEGGQDAEG